MSVALLDAYRAFKTAPANEAQAQEMVAKRRTAMAALQAQPEAAAAVLVGDWDRLDETDLDGRLSVVFLVGELDSQLGVDFLKNRALDSLAAPLAGVDTDRDARSVTMVVRTAAVDQLETRAVAGSVRARAHLLAIVEQGDEAVRKLAIHGYYRSSSARWRAKRDMAAKLSPEQRYLLNQIY